MDGWRGCQEGCRKNSTIFSGGHIGKQADGVSERPARRVQRERVRAAVGETDSVGVEERENDSDHGFPHSVRAAGGSVRACGLSGRPNGSSVDAYGPSVSAYDSPVRLPGIPSVLPDTPLVLSEIPSMLTDRP